MWKKKEVRRVPFLRLVSSDSDAVPPQNESILLRKLVSPFQAEAIDVYLKHWDTIKLLPSVLGTLETKLERAMKSSNRSDYYRVAGMAEGAALILGNDPRLMRMAERATALGDGIGDGD